METPRRGFDRIRRGGGVPGPTRTGNLGISESLLYPVELRGLTHQKPQGLPSLGFGLLGYTKLRLNWRESRDVVAITIIGQRAFAL
jgi:hypothetical protein